MLKTKNISALGWMLFSAFCFALMGAFTHSLKDTFDWRITGFARAFINFVFVVALAFATKKPLIFKAPSSLWWRSLVGTLSILCTFYIFANLPLAEATSLVNLVPIWMALIVAFVGNQSIPRSVLISILCGIAGVYFIQQPHFGQGNFAIVVGIFQALFAAIAVYNLHRTKHLHPTTVVAHFTGVASVITFFVMIPSLPHLIDGAKYSYPVIGALLGIGLSGTAAQLAMTRAYMLGNPAQNSTVGLAQVAFATVFDIVWWNRSFSLETVAGILLITVPTTFFVARIQLRNRAQNI
ncbi:MAG: DMT family transporter [Bacteroidota bacterium]|nr:DMT family transporter [Bacteroidota bacterium]